MLTNAYLLAKIGADTAENEQHFAEILPKTGNSSAPSSSMMPRSSSESGSSRRKRQAAARRWSCVCVPDFLANLWRTCGEFLSEFADFCRKFHRSSKLTKKTNFVRVPSQQLTTDTGQHENMLPLLYELTTASFRSP